ncbi:OmpA family protein [Massilia sp. CCM 9210]|uniref:OmpA family protein n=1 Tax=Massilia scottii TaxID=3057166 RepID=UPI0027968653|nr:OmpA family protein [Massilia sp. CCM 9210]MDQ1815795.1 OmpA family protein [Massilia sp. CCM 9210]
MYKTIIALAAMTALGACSSVPHPAMPSGWDRKPINSQVKIDEYRARVAEESVDRKERIALARQVEALNRQLAELKFYMMAMQADAQNGPPKARPVSQQGTVPAIEITNAESVDVRKQAIVFRMAHRYGKSAFSPTAGFQESLLKAARSSSRIVIRGRTDSAMEDDANRRVAMGRAVKARAFLIESGIPATKIQISYQAAGGFLVANDTEAGRAQNRRVEIETVDLDTTAFAVQAPLAIGAAQ